VCELVCANGLPDHVTGRCRVNTAPMSPPRCTRSRVKKIFIFFKHRYFDGLEQRKKVPVRGPINVINL